MTIHKKKHVCWSMSIYITMCDHKFSSVKIKNKIKISKNNRVATCTHTLLFLSWTQAKKQQRWHLKPILLQDLREVCKTTIFCCFGFQQFNYSVFIKICLTIWDLIAKNCDIIRGYWAYYILFGNCNLCGLNS